MEACNTPVWNHKRFASGKDGGSNPRSTGPKLAKHVLDVFYEVKGQGETEGTLRCAQRDHQASFDFGRQILNGYGKLM